MMTIDELAQRSGVTARNIRAYQSRGLLQPPSMEGRTGMYGEEHLARLDLIGRLQQRGYSLAGIADLLQAWGRDESLAEILGLERGKDPFGPSEQAQAIDDDELRAVFPEAADDPVQRARAIALGVLGTDGDATFVRSPRLFRLGTELRQAGVPAEAALDELEALQRDARAVARRFLDLFATHVLGPWLTSGPRALERLPVLLDQLQRLKPLPYEAVAVVLQRALDEAIDAVDLDRLRDWTPGEPSAVRPKPPAARQD
jgi:DNA-binding transcriptional MerR regulator